MRQINYLVLHCTASPQTTTVQSILNFWKNVNKWKTVGYHYLIKPDGEAVNLLSIETPSNGVKGHNHDSIHISYIGGVSADGKPIDNRTDLQKQTQIRLLMELKRAYPNAKILGHRDFEGVQKSCPSFSVAEFCKCIGLKVLLLMLILSCNEETKQTSQTFSPQKRDTFFVFTVRHDTIIKVRNDTIIKEKHDTIIKIKTDTLPRFKLLDTAFFHQLNDSTIEIRINNSTITMRDIKD